ncbi:drug resistance transporter, EmrB/QacA subfamily [Tsukamurella pulmonis]|uniref:Drug resistance transporter, EmrB/QacA subfamily n=2 Tax=Tsukamurella pulmonis TaxID=47312 RepID=A0A1H1HJ22_9ACTN|nr:drug resistance transporter, EmrB/QacA subfamily [Tsukamurella pulmonis]
MTAASLDPVETSASGLTHKQILYILSGLMTGMFLAALDQTIVSTAIRTIADDLNGYKLQAWVTTAYLITSTIVTPLYGKLSDIYGRKPFFMFAITVFVIGSLLCSTSTSMYELAAFRAVQGLGAGGLMSLALTIIGDIVPPRERAKYQGYFLAVFGTSSVLGPVLGGVFSGADQILGIAGWRWVFLVNVPIGIVALAVVFRVLRLPHTRREGVRIDWFGAIALSVGLVPLLIVAEQGQEWGWGSSRAIACYVVGGLGVLAFIAIEKMMGEDAIIPLRIFRNRIFAQGVLISMVVGAAMFGGISLLPQYFQVVRDASPTKAGFLMLPMVAGLMLGSILAGQMISRTGRYRVFPIIGAVLLTAGMFALHYISADVEIGWVMAGAAVIGFGLGNLMQPLTLALQNILPPRDMGVSTAAATFFRQIGGTLGVAVFLSVLFSQMPNKMSTRLSDAAADPEYTAALQRAAAGHDGPAAQDFAAKLLHGDASAVSDVMSDTSALQTLPDTLVHPLKAGFADSMDVVFLAVTVLAAIGLVLVLFWKSVPLRTAAGIEATAPDGADPASPATIEAAEISAAAESVAGTVPTEETVTEPPTGPLAPHPAVPPAPAPSGPRARQPVAPQPRRQPPVPAAPVPPSRSEIDELREQNATLAAELAELRTGYRAIAGNTRLRAAGTTDAVRFTVEATGAGGSRTGRMTVPRGEIATPAYLPVAGRGAIAGLTPRELTGLGARALVLDLHELYLQPGADVIEGAGGIGTAMAWQAPTIADTGVGAVLEQRKTKVSDEGIAFRGRLDGSPHRWDAEEAVRLAHRMGFDVAFALADPADPARTERWARRALAEHAWQTADRHDALSLWAVVTGGADPERRRSAARALRRLGEEDRRAGGLGFGGYRIEGVGAPAADAGALRAAIGELDSDRPRYLAGITGPADLLAAIEAGVDLVDGTEPARAAAEGRVYTSTGVLDVTDPALRADFRPLDPAKDRPGGGNRADDFTRAYVHHLFVANEGLAVTLCALHNEHFFVSLAAAARRAIADGAFPGFAAAFLRGFGKV